jgi:phenylpropionate dioxygenase-like ring-hydroxylating dioxygenase large terminal subunit
MSLRDGWYIAAQSNELRTRPSSVVLFGEKLVLFRNEKGEAAALLDRCAHRNIELSGGCVRDGVIECPYHGWCYNGNGSLVRVPSLGENAKLPPHRVRSFPVIEQDDYIWVFLGESAPKTEPLRFPYFGERRWTSFRMKTRFQATVDACLENFLDCPHTVFVHKGWFRSHDTRALKAWVRCGSGFAEAEFEGEPISKSVVSRLFFPKGKELKHTDRFLMPNISRVDYDFGPSRHFIITSQCTPINEWETQVYTVISFRFAAIGPLVRLVFEPLSRHIIQQDVEILAEQTKQLRANGGPHYAYVDTDLLGLKIQALRRKAERNGEGAEQDAGIPVTNREIEIRF